MQVGQSYTVTFPKQPDLDDEKGGGAAGGDMRVQPFLRPEAPRSPTLDLPSTQRHHYPTRSIRTYHVSDPAPTRIRPDQGGGGWSNHRPSKSSTQTKTTQPSVSGYPGNHTGAGTAMPWMDLYARRIEQSEHGTPRRSLVQTSGDRIERIEEIRRPRESSKKRSDRELRFLCLICFFVVLMVLILVGTVVAVVLIVMDNNNTTTTTTDNNNNGNTNTGGTDPGTGNGGGGQDSFVKTEYHIAAYEASLSFANEVFNDELLSAFDVRFATLAETTCSKVDTIFINNDNFTGCEVELFREVQGTLYAEILVFFLHKVEVDVPFVSSLEEEAALLQMELSRQTGARGPGLRDVYMFGVNNDPETGNAAINNVPETIMLADPFQDYCLEFPCENGGTCVLRGVGDVNTNFRCNCPNSHLGRRCQASRF